MKFNLFPYRLLGFLFASVLFLAVPLGAMSLDFQQNNYTVAPGDEITLQTAFAEPIPDGLSSYHLRLTFAEGLLELTEEDIAIPPELDFSFLDPGAPRSVTATWADIRGFADWGETYGGTEFVTYTVAIGVNAPSGEQTVILQIPGDNSFVDGDGNVIDDQIILGTATITVVVPPPEISGPLTIDSANGSAAMSFTGFPGRTYEVERSSDLESWNTIADVTADSEGNILFEDTTASNFDRRFYRLADR